MALWSSAATTEESTPPERPSNTLALADLRAHARDGVVDDVADAPQRLAAADLAHETLQQLLALQACA